MSKLWQTAAMTARGDTLLPTAAEDEAAIQRLANFMASADGSDAMDLLDATRRRIVFGEKRISDDYKTVYALAKDGLCYFIEPIGTPTNATTHNPESQFMTATEAIIAVRAKSAVKPLDFVPWLNDQLNALAHSIVDSR